MGLWSNLRLLAKFSRRNLILTPIEIGKALVVNPRVCGGRLIFKGTRILVADVIELTEAGCSPEDVAGEYGGLITTQAVREVLSLIRRGVVKEVGRKDRASA